MPSIDLVSEIARGEARTALVFADGRALSYADLDRLTLQFAARLGQAEKQLVAISAQSSEHAVVAYLASLRAGHAVAMLPPCDERLWDEFVATFEPDFTYRQKMAAGASSGRLGLREMRSRCTQTSHCSS
ncbi:MULTISPECIES: AMP-binding protein [unclassified Mesorhizobium]|uniref:AMP-binding protein n=1 Tax=unclassified Mesorhizobium TaxID=325217 RepID=UPI001FED8B5A|nr:MULTISPECIES: AMP-binding protein [unclassified Mesorhizobium]